jgi:Xaa-Pro aminopeptidase
LELDDWLMANLKSGQTVALDPWLSSAGSARALEKRLSERGIKLLPLEQNPIHGVWTARPARSDAPVIFHPLEFAGETTASKVEKIRAKLSERTADALVVSALDEVAWLFNIRGSDVEFNPVVTAYGVVTMNEGLHLFIDAGKVASAPPGALDGITVHAYEDIESFLKSLSSRGLKTMADPAQLNWRLYRAIEGAVVNAPSPISLPKSLKNAVELQGIRKAHVRDGVALTAFIAWLHKTIRSGARELTEFDVAEIIETYRGKMDLHVSPSFATIAGYGKNGETFSFWSDMLTYILITSSRIYE